MLMAGEMKPKKNPGKLRVLREVLKRVSGTDLDRVAGGMKFTVDSVDNCTGNSKLPECTKAH